MRKDRQAGIPFILITVFLDMLGIGVVIPVLPSLVGTLTTGREHQSYWYGALLASYGITQFLGAPLLGALSDRFGRRPVLLASIFGFGFNFLLTAVSPWLWLLLVSRLIGGATGGSFSVAGAYIADVTAPEQRSKSFGKLGAAFGLGFVCGPMLGGLLGSYDLRLPYFVAASLSLLNWLYGFFLLPESHLRERRAPFSIAKANPFSSLAALSRLRGVGSLISVYALAMLTQSIVQSTWVLYTNFRFGWGPRENGISLFVVGVASALAQGWLLGLLLKRYGELRAALFGLTSGFLAYVFYGAATEGWMMYGIIFANLLGFTAGPALQGIVSKSVDAHKQGVTMGSLTAISGIMAVIGPLTSAPLLAMVGRLRPGDWRAGMTFFLCALLQAIALAQALRHFRKSDLQSVSAERSGR
jgi:DHA1 family tetracycline resistance protein-like MFS transporter